MVIELKHSWYDDDTRRMSCYTTSENAAHAECPACGGEVDLTFEPQEGDEFDCYHCAATIEIATISQGEE